MCAARDGTRDANWCALGSVTIDERERGLVAWAEVRVIGAVVHVPGP